MDWPILYTGNPYMHNQDKSAWSWKIELRSSVEKF